MMLLFCGGCGRELMLWATVGGWVCPRAVESGFVVVFATRSD